MLSVIHVRLVDDPTTTDPEHRQPVLASAVHVAAVNRYNHDLKTGTVKASRNSGACCSCA